MKYAIVLSLLAATCLQAAIDLTPYQKKARKDAILNSGSVVTNIDMKGVGAAIEAYIGPPVSAPVKLVATDDPNVYFSLSGTTGFVYRVTTNVWLVTVNPALMSGLDLLLPAGQYIDYALPSPGGIAPDTWYEPTFGGNIAARPFESQYTMFYLLGGNSSWESSPIQTTATSFILNPSGGLVGVLAYNFQDATNMVFRMATTNETELLRAWSEAQIAELDSKITDNRTVAQNLWTTLSSHNDTYNGDFATTNLEGFAAFVTNTSPAVAESGGISGAVTNTYLFNMDTTNGRVQTATVSAKLYATGGTRNIYATLYHYDAAGIATCSNTVASPNPNDSRPVFTNTLSISSLSVSGRIVLAIRVEQASGFSKVTTGYGVNDYPMLLSLTHVPLAYVTQSELAAATAGSSSVSNLTVNSVLNTSTVTGQVDFTSAAAVRVPYPSSGSDAVTVDYLGVRGATNLVVNGAAQLWNPDTRTLTATVAAGGASGILVLENITNTVGFIAMQVVTNATLGGAVSTNFFTSRALVPKTGQTNSWSVNGSDGDLQKGFVLPTPRFAAIADTGAPTNQIRDLLTGLVWDRNASRTSATLDATYSTIAQMNADNYGGANDWRLSNLKELFSILHFGYFSPAICNTAGTGKWTAGDPFNGVNVATSYATSDSRIQNTNQVYGVGIGEGGVGFATKQTSLPFWPVRGP